VFSPATVALVGVGAPYAQTTTVQETGYTGTLTITSTTCAPVATISPTSGNGPTLVVTVTGVAAGACMATVADSSGNTAQLQIGVTTSTVGGNAKERMR
jgi:hypothetical protein